MQSRHKKIFLAAILFFILAINVAGCGNSPTVSNEENPTITSTTPGPNNSGTIDNNNDNNGTPSNLISIESYTPELRTADTLITPNALDEDFTRSYNNLAFNIYAYFNKGNLVFGPYIVLQVLGMTASGAGTTTAEQIKNGFLSGQDVGNWLNTVYSFNQSVINEGRSDPNHFNEKNIAWGQTGYLFSKDYLDLISKYYSPELSAVDYLTLGSAYTGLLNNLVSDATSGRITWIPLYSGTPERTRLVLGNVSWLENALGTGSDTVESFEGLFDNGQQYWVTMVRYNGAYNSYRDDEVEAVELPIGITGISMAVFMPFDGKFDSFSEKLHERIPAIISAFTPKNIEIALPVYNFTSGIDLQGFMKDKGVYTAFDKTSADFSGINGQGYCYLKKYMNESTFGIDKESTYIGSAAVAVIEATPDEPKDLWSGDHGSINTKSGCPMIYKKAGVADARQFIFIIRDTNTNAILFMGRLTYAGGKEAGSWVCSP